MTQWLRFYDDRVIWDDVEALNAAGMPDTGIAAALTHFYGERIVPSQVKRIRERHGIMPLRPGRRFAVEATS